MTPDEQAEITMVIGGTYQNGGNQLTETSLEDAIDFHNGSNRDLIVRRKLSWPTGQSS